MGRAVLQRRSQAGSRRRCSLVTRRRRRFVAGEATLAGHNAGLSWLSEEPRKKLRTGPRRGPVGEASYFRSPARTRIRRLGATYFCAALPKSSFDSDWIFSFTPFKKPSVRLT